MSEEALPQPKREVAGRRPWISRVGRPVYDAVIGEPVREGRLRIEGTGRLERQLAILGLVTLFALLASVVLNEAWRSGPLTKLTDIGGRWLFFPEALLPVTLLGLFIAWLVLLTGGLRASLPVRLAVAVVYLLLNSDIGKPLTIDVGGALALRWGSPLARIGYFAAAGLLLVYSFFAGSERWSRRLRPAFFVAIALSLAALFGAQLWIHVAESRSGIPDPSPGFLYSAIEQMAFALTPMIMLATVALVDFSYALADAFATPARTLRPTFAKLMVVGLIGVKLWVQLFSHLRDWRSRIEQTPQIVLMMALVLAGFLTVAVIARRLRRRQASEEEVEEAKERLIYAGIATASVPMITPFFSSLGALLVIQFGLKGAGDVLGKITNATSDITNVVRVVSWSVVLVLGIVLLLRLAHRELYRELGIGLALLGAFNVPYYAAVLLHHPLAFNSGVLDIMLTVVLAGIVAVRWNRLDTYEAAGLFAVVAFSWLVMTRGDFIGIIGGFFGLATIVIVVFGLLYTLLADSALASGDGRLFPHDARVLLWVGYLVLSVAILNAVTAAHGFDFSAATAARAFTDVGIPIAAWLVIRRPFARREALLAALPAEEPEVEV